MLWRDGLGVVALAAVFVLVLALLVVGRARLLRRRGATVECSLRRDRDAVWHHGVGRYDGDALRWYRSFGAHLRPDAVVRRRGLSVDVRRCPVGEESRTLAAVGAGAGPGVEVLQCTATDGRTVELALPAPVVPGFLAWLESVPPQGHLADR